MWMPKSLATSPVGGAFLLAYPRQGIEKVLSLIQDKKFNPVADGQGTYCFCGRVIFQKYRPPVNKNVDQVSINVYYSFMFNRQEE